MNNSITAYDVYQRGRTAGSFFNESVLPNDIYSNAMKSTNIEIIESAINDWELLDPNRYEAFNKALDLLEHAAEFSSDGAIKRLTTTITESSVKKLRNGAETAKYIKNKLSRFKTKITTKVNTRIKKAEEAVPSALAKRTSPQPAKATSPKAANPKQQKASDAAVEEAYISMLEAADRVTQCDRVLANNDRISKRYNLDKLAYFSESVEDFVFGMCKLVETYNIPYYAKYSIVLENAPYTLYKNRLPYDMVDIAEAATTYFLLKEDFDVDYINGLAKILTENKFVTDDARAAVDYVIHPERVMVNESVDNILDYNAIINGSSLLEAEDYMSILEAKKDKSGKIKDIISSFKLDPKKTAQKFERTMSKLFSLRANEIADDLPTILVFLESTVIIGTIAINPLLGAIVALTDMLLNVHYGGAHLPKAIKSYDNEIKAAKKKLDKTKDKTTKRDLEQYIAALESSKEKLESRYNEIKTVKDDEDEDEASDIDEAAVALAVDLRVMQELADSIDINKLYGYVPSLEVANESSYDIFDDYAKCVGCCISDPKLKDSIMDGFNSAYQALKESDEPNKYFHMEYINSANSLLAETTLIPMDENSLEYNINYLDALYELCQSVDLLTEDSKFVNQLKLAGSRLKTAAANLSDKEKMMSKTIDGSLESMRRSIEKSLTTDNREAIIKGQVVPSASKVIKMAITGGVAWMVNPALAVIGAIGAFAMSKKLSAKERQILLDEINVELEMADRHLKIAEDKNDMKATRDILQIQKRLQREKSRLTYRAKYQYNDHIDTGTKDKD